MAAAAAMDEAPSSVVLGCWDASVGPAEGSTVLARVDGRVDYPAMRLDLWMAQLADVRTPHEGAEVHLCGRAPLSVMLLLGHRLCDAGRITVGPFSVDPQAAIRDGDHPFGERAVKVASNGMRKGPTVLYLTIKDANRVRFEDFPPALNVRYLVTTTPCDNADLVLTEENQRTVMGQTVGALHEAIDIVEDVTGPDDPVYLATSTPAPLAVLMGAVVRCSRLRNPVALLERSHETGKYVEAWSHGRLPLDE